MASAANNSSLDRFEALFEQAPISVQVLSRNGRTVRVNRAWEKLWQPPGDDTLKHYVLNEYNMLEDPQLAAKGVTPLLRQAFAGKPVVLPEVLYDPAELGMPGRPRWVKASAHPLKDDAGQVLEVMVIHEDVTERVESARALAASEERLRAATDAVPALISYLDRDLRYQLVNKAYETWFGTPRESVVGKTLPEVLGPAAFETVREHVEAALSGKRARFEASLAYKDGGQRYVQGTYEPEFDAGGKVRGFFALILDVSAHKKAEEAVIASERLVRTATTGAGVGLVVVNSAYEYLFCNEAYATVLGVRAEDLIGRRVYEVMAGGWSQIKPHLDRAMGGERVEYELQLAPLREGADVRWFAVTYQPLETAKEPRVVVTVMDISERKRMDDELREAARSKDEFLATLAHELRNPLAPISNSLEIMARARGDQNLQERARIVMRRQLSHLVRLVDDLLDIGRVTSGRLELRQGRVKLADLVAQAAESSRPLFTEAGHELAIGDIDESLEVEVDPVRIVQILGNLLNNAAKYTEPGGRISVTVEQRGSQVRVAVRDSGIGIAPEMLPRLFEMFSRADHTLERARGGLGVGLTLARRLAELHGGTVTAASEGVGKGSEFTLALPLPPSLPRGTP